MQRKADPLLLLTECSVYPHSVSKWQETRWRMLSLWERERLWVNLLWRLSSGGRWLSRDTLWLNIEATEASLCSSFDARAVSVHQNPEMSGERFTGASKIVLTPLYVRVHIRFSWRLSRIWWNGGDSRRCLAVQRRSQKLKNTVAASVGVGDVSGLILRLHFPAYFASSSARTWGDAEDNN